MKVIPRKSLPIKMPAHLTITILLAIKVYEPSGVALGITGTLLVILWMIYFVGLILEEPTELSDLKSSKNS